MTINYLAVLVCAIISMIIGSIWYGPLFGKTWMKIMGADSMSAEKKEAMKKSMGVMYFIQFILSLITATVLAYFINIAAMSVPMVSGVCIAIIAWFGFGLAIHAGGALWSGKPKKIACKMFCIAAGAQLITFIAFGLILGAWR
jgi:hypothetical protein